jgi:hypothetical protein
MNDFLLFKINSLLEILIIDFLQLIVELVALKQLDLVFHNTEVIMDNKFDHIQHYMLILNNVYLPIECWLDDVLYFHFDLVVFSVMLQDHHM